MKNLDDAVSYVQQARYALPLHKESYDFIQEHKPWKGLLKHKWIFRVSVLIAFLISLRFIKVFTDWLSVNIFSQGSEDALQNNSSLFQGFADFGSDLFISGGYKYMILFFVEIIIFHCAVKTLNILLNENRTPSFKDFIEAQKRMFKVTIRAYVYEVICTFLISTALSMIGFEFLKHVPIFLVQCYFLGVAFMDNYNEQFGIEIKESFAIIQQHAGAAVAIGFVAYIFFMIPIAGLFVGPVLAAVTASMYMYSQEINLHIKRHIQLDLV